MTTKAVTFTDAELTAYLDGEADADLLSRIDAALEDDAGLADRMSDLSAGMDALVAAFDLDRLEPPAYVPVATTTAPQRMNRIAAPMALAASFVLGMVVMRILQPAPNWVDTVANYQALYVTETLAGTAQSAEVSESVFETADASLGVDLRPATEIEGLAFKRAQLLAIEGRTLVQMAYLDAEGRPFAFCAVRLDDGDQSILSEMSHGLAAASWVEDGVGYVLIGGEDVDAVSAMTSQVQRSL